MIKVSILALTILFISSCAPKYKIVHDYTPPTSTYGLSCLNKQCHKENSHCKHQCQTQFNNCLIKQEHDAAGDYNHILNEYHVKLEHYHNELEYYFQDKEHYRKNKKFLKHKQEHALEQCKNKNLSKEKCPSYKRIKKKLNRLNKPYKPVKPHKPSLQQVIAEYQRSCQSDCQCKQGFNQCYVGCGGQVNSRKICIDNCD